MLINTLSSFGVCVGSTILRCFEASLLHERVESDSGKGKSYSPFVS